MGVIRLSGRLFKWAVVAYVAMTLAMIAWTFAWPEPDVRNMAPADVIVCLGGGMSPNGTLSQDTLTRVDRCVQLYEAGIAPVVIFTGGTARPHGPSAGYQMGQYAISLGLPADRVIEEGRAQSTLQNALYSIELAIGAQEFVIVTEAFHLPRAWASFHWARWEMGRPNSKTFRLVMSENVRSTAEGDVSATILFRESLAIWFNAARAAAFSVATLAGVDPKARAHWLH